MTLAVLSASVAALCFPTPARAKLPSSRTFGPAIEYIGYDGQERCSPEAKPGMLAFRRMVLARYPYTRDVGISRACHIGGRSEHKEGRAWDWGVNAAYESHREIVKDLFGWLLSDDRYGNPAAMAKRLGIMYIIWNRKIWGSWGGGWRTYCVQKPRGCVSPADGTVRSPHTDHVHFSMSRAGAKMQTTFWNKKRSMLAEVAPHPSSGHWNLGRNGHVAAVGSRWFGSKSDVILAKPASAMAPTASGGGYWIVTKGGRVFPFGDARNRGQLTGKRITVVDMQTTPTGNGYWLLARSGRVFAYGDAAALGGAKSSGMRFAGMASTPTGLGYWLFATTGSVFSFGDASDLGGLATESLGSPVIGGDNYGASGYWLATAAGRVVAVGGAPKLGHPGEVGVPIAGFSSHPTGNGYWVMNEKGRLWSFGDAPVTGSSVGARSVTTSGVGHEPVPPVSD